MAPPTGQRPPLSVHYLGGPTTVLEIGGLRLLTDPTFDPPGDYPTPAGILTKTAGPALPRTGIGAIDAVLLSHDQHPDNLDDAGRAHLAEMPLVLSTRSAEERLGGSTRHLANWSHVDLPCPDGTALRVTGVPALHGPPGSEPFVGEVTGFVLSGERVPTVYVSGDNASLDVVREIKEQSPPIDVAILFVGAVQISAMPGAYLTLTSAEAAQAARILGAREVVAVHFEQWNHYTEGRDNLRYAFEEAGLGGRFHLPGMGEHVLLPAG
ncbi:MBL fold metallo-hydrolase [Streptomyces sp. NPDC059070]|uniref:MBL fold metallo-hydrolase n=1 Tax=unclassified Streptomyces TaxID=2593676 RepID=UPI0034E2C286